MQVPSLAGKLRSHMLHGNAKNFVKLNGCHLQAVELGKLTHFFKIQSFTLKWKQLCPTYRAAMRIKSLKCPRCYLVLCPEPNRAQEVLIFLSLYRQAFQNLCFLKSNLS